VLIVPLDWVKAITAGRAVSAISAKTKPFIIANYVQIYFVHNIHKMPLNGTTQRDIDR